MSDKLKGWKEIPIGGLVVEAGNASRYDTGSWRSFCPVRDEKKCTNCLLCWIYCPDAAIKVKEGKISEIDLKHCKGCGICAKACPPKVGAIRMVEEAEIRG